VHVDHNGALPGRDNYLPEAAVQGVIDTERRTTGGAIQDR